MAILDFGFSMIVFLGNSISSDTSLLKVSGTQLTESRIGESTMKHSIRLRLVAGAVLGRYFMMKLPLAVCLLCFASLVFICHPVSAQQVKKVTRGIEPVSLGPLIVGDNIKSKDGELNIQDELTLAKDSRWAQTLKVEVRNNYSKPMIYFELGVHVYSKTPGKDPFFLFFPKGFFNFTGAPPPGAPKPEEISGECEFFSVGIETTASEAGREMSSINFQERRVNL